MRIFEIIDDCGWKHIIETDRDTTAAEIEMFTPHVRHAREIRRATMKPSDLKSPCKDCADRHSLCHAECDKYKRYSEARTAFNKWQRDIARSDGMDATRGERIKRKIRRKLGGMNK